MLKINLPSRYEYKEGISNPLYKQYHGMNKISYSQVGSFLDYRGDYIMQKFLGVKLPDGEFALFGNACGNYLNLHDLEPSEPEQWLSKDDKDILDNFIKEFYDSDKQNLGFETEIIVDLRPFGIDAVLQGFSDVQYNNPDCEKINIVDFKTLNLDTKAKYYASSEYKQLKIYGFGLEELGRTVGSTYVVGIGRKGNSINGVGNYKMRLSGSIKRIDNPYNRDEAIEAIQEVVEICQEISDYYSTFLKYFSNAK